jgi:ELWxxDGT repeat protein
VTVAESTGAATKRKAASTQLILVVVLLPRLVQNRTMVFHPLREQTRRHRHRTSFRWWGLSSPCLVAVLCLAACGDDCAEDAAPAGSAGSSGVAGNGGASSSSGGGGAAAFSLGGTVTGLHGSITLSNGGESLVVEADGSFTFAAPLDDGADYEVAIEVQPTTQGCQIENQTGSVAGGNVSNVTVSCEDGLFFEANDGTHGRELWFTDGTAARTTLVLDIDPTGDALPGGFVRMGAQVFFTASDGENGRELWVTDGTPEGTTMLMDANPLGDSNAAAHLVFDGALFFMATNADAQHELWRTDGTEAGSSLIETFDDLVSGLVDVGDALLFRAPGTSIYQLWVSDGTPAGTDVLVPEVPDAMYGALTTGSAVLGQVAIFAGTTAEFGGELWKSDATFAGTEQVKDINLAGSSSPAAFKRVGNVVCFIANDGIHGVEPHCSDGSDEGTYLLEDINPDGDANIYALSEAGGRLFFTARDDDSGNELWTSDGTPQGTTKVLVEEVFADPLILPLGARVVFIADDGVHGREPWISDGTPAGTHMLKDVDPRGSSDVYAPLRAFGSRAIFFLQDADHGIEPWVTDGTEAGTLLLKDINPTGDSQTGS